MKLNCCDLPCPQPVLKTKEALNSLKLGESLEILLNSSTSTDNVSRFLNSLKQNFNLSQNGDFYEISLIKSAENNDNLNVSEYSCQNTQSKTKLANKIIYLNESSAGSGAVGQSLLASFLGAFSQCEIKPKYVICVNDAVKISANRGHLAFRALNDLQNQGCEILSCGSCLQAYGLSDKLSIGRVSNAYEIANILLEYEQITL